MNLREIVSCGYFIGFIICWPLIGGMFFSSMQFKYKTIAKQTYREDIGMSIIVGFLYSLVWPVMLPAAYCLTGFAEFGVWRRYKGD